jgi:hypothetical protein
MATKQVEQLDEKVEVGGGATGKSMSADPTGTVAAAPGKSNKNGEPMQKGQNPAGTAIEDTDSENNVKPTMDSGKAKASLATKPSAASASMKEDIEAMFVGSELSEEFKEKASVLFEAAVAAKVADLRASLEEEYEAKFEETFAESVKGLTEKLDSYLNYVVEQYMEENKLAIETSLRTEITEEFITSLHELFVQHNIDLPDEKVDVVEELAAEVEGLQQQLNNVIDANLEMTKTIDEYNRQLAFAEVAEGLADTQVEKLATLAEGVDYADADSYKKKLEIVKENYFSGEKKAVKPALLNEEADPVEEEAAPVTGPIASYVKAISRTIVK